MQTIEIVIPGNPIAPRRKRGKVRHGRIASDPSSPLGQVLTALRAQAPATPFTGHVFLELIAHVLPPKRASRRTSAAMLAGGVVPTGCPGFDALVEFWSDILGRVICLDGCQVGGAIAKLGYAEEAQTVITVRKIRLH